MTSFTSPSPIWDFHFDISEWHILPARAREHLRSCLHLSNPCAKRRVLSLTKPNGKIYEMKSLGHYITLYFIIYFDLLSPNFCKFSFDHYKYESVLTLTPKHVSFIFFYHYIKLSVLNFFFYRLSPNSNSSSDSLLFPGFFPSFIALFWKCCVPYCFRLSGKFHIFLQFFTFLSKRSSGKKKCDTTSPYWI